MLKLKNSLLRSRDGTAGIEFALVLPLLIALFYGICEYSNYVMIYRRAQFAVTMAADFVSRDADDDIDYQQRWVAEDIWGIANPTAYGATQTQGWGNWNDNYSRALASVEFIKAANCSGSQCTFAPHVLWTYRAPGIISKKMQKECSLQVVDNSAPPANNTLAAGYLGRGPIVIADFVYKYKPLIKTGFLQEREIGVEAVRRTRSGNPLKHEPDYWVTQCS